MRGIHFALFAVTVVAVAGNPLDNSRQSLQCKNIARDVIINSCKGPRIKRSLDQSELMKIVQEMSKFDQPESVGTNDDQIQVKRDYYLLEPRTGLLPPLAFGLPGQSYMQDKYHQSELVVPGLEFMDTSYGSMVQHGYRPPIPYRPVGYGLRSINPDDLLGFSLNAEELEELHDEIGDRMPRNSKDQNKKIFQLVAAKCCRNENFCYDHPDLIPCMGF
ncbi:hypothetical protein WN48_02246 [Eufriesea mexicana]|uniref:Uncharacterized protein n=1 Tax=Eufriesea mexicana TaxID=516756 RepID=A0A310SQN3_9HYME|nr:PREDICTED: uncharacterized protein LOC108548360 [Eufriesea mexicana]OAD57355.1 hypothetical protein WN48_02246 [Eufriesea mexicana]